jgi:hypothetical protein
MLGGLVAVPALALFGNGWADSAKQLLQRQLGLWSTSTTAALAEAPLFVPGRTLATPPTTTQSLAAQPLVPPVVSLPSPASVESPATPASLPASWPPLATSAPAPTASIAPVPPVVQQSVMPALSLAAQGTNAVQATAFEAPCAVAPVTDARQAAVAAPSSPSVYASQPNLVPVPRAINTSLETRTPTVAGSSPEADRFGSMHARLRQLGATYCLLESWGPQSELYRFHCKLGIGGSANFTRSFEATDPDPMGAMAKVMAQVEQWQAARP